MTQLTSYHNPQNPLVTNPWQLIAKCLQLSQGDLERLADSDLALLQQRAQEYGETLTAARRIRNLEPMARRRYGPTTRLLVKLVVVAIGALSFSTGIQLFAQRFGHLALAVAIVGGGLASACMDGLATRTSTNLQKRRDLNRQLRQLEHQVQLDCLPDTDLKQIYHRAQRRALEQVEGSNRIGQVPVLGLVAWGMSACELAITLYVVNRLGLTSSLPLPIQVLVAGLPVLLTWAASLLQSEYFERPDYAADLIPQYQAHLRPGLDLTPKAVEDWCLDRAFQDGRLDSAITFVLEGDPTLQLKNVAMARAQYEIDYHHGYIRWLEQTCNTLIMDRWQAFQAERARLPQEAPQLPIVERNHSAREIYEQTQASQTAIRRWVEEELPRRLNLCNQDVLALKADYAAAIRRHHRQLKQAEKAYQQAHEQWQVERSRWAS